MATKRIVVLGAGYGGVIAAQTLHKRLKKHDDVEIVLIDQNNYQHKRLPSYMKSLATGWSRKRKKILKSMF